VEFRVLGPLQVFSNGHPLAIGGLTRRALLAYLLLRANRPVSTDELTEAIWNGDPPHTASSSLQNHVSRLRRVLGADRLLTRARGYELRVAPGELDLQRLEALVDEAERLEPAGCAARLREALALWRGAPLAELSTFEFACWERGRLDERRLEILEDCIDAELASGHGDSVVSELSGLVAEHPLRERLRGQLMLALYVHGRQAEALDVFRAGRELLVEETGLEPGPALRELERAILRQEVAVSAAAVAANRGPDRRPSRGRASAAVAVAAVLAAVLVAVFVALLAPGERAGGLAGVAANSLGVIDPERNELVTAIPVGQRPLALDVGQGAVWVANGGDRTISRIDPSRRALVGNIPARTAHGSVQVGRDAVWVVGRLGRTPGLEAVVARIDPDVDAVTASARYEATSERYDQVMSIGTGLGSVWATASWRLLRLDQRGRLLREVGEFTSARGLAVGAGAVWVGDVAQPATGGSAVLRIDPETNGVTARIPVPPEPAAIAVADGTVWVASDNGTLSRIDPVANVVTATVELGGALSGVAVDANAVWVANSGTHTVARIDPETNEVVARIELGTRPEAIAVGEGAVWVTAY
jgi:YVTN family beta-propeller protein